MSLASLSTNTGNTAEHILGQPEVKTSQTVTYERQHIVSCQPANLRLFTCFPLIMFCKDYCLDSIPDNDILVSKVLHLCTTCSWQTGGHFLQNQVAVCKLY